MGLARVRERLGVHVLVQGAVQGVVEQLIRWVGGEVPQQPVADLAHVLEGLPARGQRQVPARVVGDLHRVVEDVLVGADRGLAAGVPERPHRLEPGVVAHLPEAGVDGGELRAHQLLVAEIGDELEGALPGVPHPIRQLFRRYQLSD